MTYILISLAFILSFLLAILSYKSRLKQKRSLLNISLTALRALSLFLVFVLLINPKFSQSTFTTEKPKLLVIVDDSESVSHLEQDANALAFVDAISKDKDINSKFEVSMYSVGESLETLDTLKFNQRESLLSKAFEGIGDIYKQENLAVVLVSDGNQTKGADLAYLPFINKVPVYPLILGDTISYDDLAITALNANKYAYFNNKFPIEATLIYRGNQPIKSKFLIKQNTKIIHEQEVSFNPADNSKILTLNLTASQKGLQSYSAELIPMATEKNKTNNSRNFAIEVIDQKSKIGIISNISHPDIGAFKKSIEANNEREVIVLNTTTYKSKITDLKAVVIYQPNDNFKPVFDDIFRLNLNVFIVTGAQTDYEFLNASQNSFQIVNTNQTEFYEPELNANYSTFLIDGFEFNDYPPLLSPFGSLSFTKQYSPILFKKIRNIPTQSPLLSTYSDENSKNALLAGEGLWQWRANSYLQNGTFENFDLFLDKIIQYISVTSEKSRLNVDYETFYNSQTAAIIKAQYFNENLELDTSIPLDFELIKKDSLRQLAPMRLSNNHYQIDISSLESGTYDFNVYALNRSIRKSGTFTIIPYNVEQQFLNANVTKLEEVATNSKTQAYFSNNYSELITTLVDSKKFLSIQKQYNSISDIINWKYMLFFIVLCLSLEWFIRKYNGLI